MRRFIVVYAVWVSAQFLVDGARRVSPLISRMSVDAWAANYEAEILKDFPRERMPVSTQRVLSDPEHRIENDSADNL